VLALLALLVLAACSSAPPPRPLSAPLPPYRDGARLVVLGDVQRTSKLEVWREDNPHERARILAGVAEASPDLVAFTGDLVFDGGADDHWSEFDDLASPIRARSIPVITAFGNHEYWGGRRAAEKNVFSRIPLTQKRHWYSVAFGPLRLVVLDSNDSQLSKEEWQEQRRWYEETLDTADASAQTRGVLVLLHHPPFTNSTVTSDEPAVQSAFVPGLLRAKKTLAMLSGHVHDYERFERNGKTFLVSGGGGGPRAELQAGDKRRHPDDLFAGPSIRDFHFTIYTVSETAVEAEVRGLPKGGAAFYTMDRFTLRYP
jgi:Icc-related predicted phosphoesterase